MKKLAKPSRFQRDPNNENCVIIHFDEITGIPPIEAINKPYRDALESSGVLVD